MKSKKSVILTAVGLSVSVGFVAWRYAASQSRPLPLRAVIVHDRSGSTRERCAALSRLLERVLSEKTLGRGSSLVILATGDESTANEPSLLAAYEMPTSRRSMEGRQAIVEQRVSILADLETKCADLKLSQNSPILLAVKRAVEQLGCAGSVTPATCGLVFIQSDGEETVVREIKDALAGAARSKLRLPAPINNAGVAITWCGLAETVGLTVKAGGRRQAITAGRDGTTSDRLQRVWRSLFTQPDLLRFEPYCTAHSSTLVSPPLATSPPNKGVTEP